MRCAIVTCPEQRFTNGKPHPFCLGHLAQFNVSPEGINPRPSSESDFRDRVWKETCVELAAAKWESASLEQRAEWAKGGFGR